MIELKNIVYKVIERGQEKTILDDVSCVFHDACLTAITGQNGSGKSTLMKIIMGIIKPNSGSVLFNGKDITNLTIDERARLGLNYAFQQPITFKGVTIKELMDIATNEKNSIPKVCEYLSKVGVCAKEYVNREFNDTLSGGEQKRIELALALAKKGSCYLFDEPEAGIDLWSFSRLADLFAKDKCYIVVSHQEKLLQKADKILVLKQGKVEKAGDAKDILPTLKNLTCAKIEGGK